MLTTLKRWLGHGSAVAAPESPPEAHHEAVGGGLVTARAEELETFLEAVRRADSRGHAPWVLRDEAHLVTLRRALEFTLHRGRWLQREGEAVAHWQGRLLAFRHGEGPPLGMLLAVRPDEEAAWQLRFFFIDPQWQGSGHGARLLLAARRELDGTPLHCRLPLACGAAVTSLERAGFRRMQVDATEVASFEAPAEWH
ncbi:GNAT family N-acetyltransferase [Bisbaumannia pacifica]|uniref:GNAT family N-acetyltransferase n=1 Tax=Bisbaumannia pacifica TaxID=77098 RepID=A0ABD4L537_9GAMM|nr:GNAT family N-acetyltransferase [Halomonas pacifica]MBH8580702.1 GNAT family N-acetyltransferase [Halomonas pacifica]